MCVLLLIPTVQISHIHILLLCHCRCGGQPQSKMLRVVRRMRLNRCRRAGFLPLAVLVVAIHIVLQAATSAPLIERSIERATGIVYNITGGSDLTLQEVNRCATYSCKGADYKALVAYWH